MTQPAPVTSNTPYPSHVQHAINNRIQALLLGVDLLERSDDDSVRDIARELRAELDDLHHLLRTQHST
jgi:BMFP domain-containing protein YqiC